MIAADDTPEDRIAVPAALARLRRFPLDGALFLFDRDTGLSALCDGPETAHLRQRAAPRGSSHRRWRDEMGSQRDLSWMFAALLACSTACGNKPAPTPEKEGPAGAAASAPAASASASAASTPAASQPAAKTIPTLVPEKLRPKEGKPDRAFPIEGAVMVADGFRVGRVVGDDVEWIGQIPKSVAAFGANVLDRVVGRWPDRVAALYQNSNPRANQPTYYPLASKAGGYRVSEGRAGYIKATARVGDSILLSELDYVTGYHLTTVQGPPLARPQQQAKDVGCKLSEMPSFMGHVGPAIAPEVMESTPAGTLMTLSSLCTTGVPAVEVWDRTGKSRIIKLDRWWKSWSQLLKGSGDEMFAHATAFDPVLRYHDGAFEPVPRLEGPIRKALTSPSGGKLHAIDGRVLHRYEDGKWAPVAMLPDQVDETTLLIDDQGTLWLPDATRLREGSAVPAPSGCDTWLVYMYRSSWKNQKSYTYPSTRKALASFPEAASLGLVEFAYGAETHLGVQVTSKAQGEAVIAHLATTMKEESPRLFCHQPRSPRKIELTAP